MLREEYSPRRQSILRRVYTRNMKGEWERVLVGGYLAAMDRTRRGKREIESAKSVKSGRAESVARSHLRDKAELEARKLRGETRARLIARPKAHVPFFPPVPFFLEPSFRRPHTPDLARFASPDFRRRRARAHASLVRHSLQFRRDSICNFFVKLVCSQIGWGKPREDSLYFLFRCL